jgi:hypothetical protein
MTLEMPGMPTPEARLQALGRLAKLLCDDDTLLDEIGVAWNEPERYVTARAERLSDRGIEKPIPQLAFIALVDALQARKRCVEIDWRADPRDMVKAVRTLLRGFQRKGWKPPRLEDGVELAELLSVVGSSIEGMGLSLCHLDHQSDSYALVLMATHDVNAATELALSSDVGRLSVFRVKEDAVKPPVAIRLCTITTIDVASREPPREFFALPRRRVVTFDGKVLHLSGPEGSGSVTLDGELLPDFDPSADAPRHVLVRSGQHFGLASGQFVRLWSPSGESVLYRNEPALTPDDGGGHAGVAYGGISDDPTVVVAVFRPADAGLGALLPVVLRLTTGKKRTARLDVLHPRERLSAIAWHDDSPYVVARGNREGTESYAVYSRCLAPPGDLAPLIDLGEDCTSRVSSSFGHLLVTYVRRQGAPCAVFSLAQPSQAPRALELPPGTTILDHEQDGFWYFEPRGSRGRYVLAEPVGS